MKNIFTLCLLFFSMSLAFGGNPDRQGEAGAAELLLNPWARSAGLHSMSTSSVSGVEAMRINVAGIGRIKSSGEVQFANTRLYQGSSLGMNSIGLVTKVSKNGTLGVSLVAMDFGDIPVTTTDQPEGVGATYSPSFFNLGVGYAHTYENKISVGALVRVISESLPTVSASGFAIDAGVQYVSGEKDNFKLGISLRNIGSTMEFGGEGLSFQTDAPEATTQYNLTVNHRAEDFELPSMLNIGLSYDFYFGDDYFIRGLGNFTSNAFARDDIGVGAEFYYKDLVVLRGGYKIPLGKSDGSVRSNLYTGFSAGVSVDVPLKRANNRVVGIDYAYRATNPFKGTHNFSLRFAF